MKKRNILLIFIVVLIAAILRFWNIGGLFSFGIDEEYQSFLAWSQVKDFHPIWIGVSAANIGYYLGPGFTYLNALLFLFSHGDPIILGYFSAVLGLATTLSVYYVTKQLFTQKAAFIASLIYASSTLMVFYDRRFWNPTPLPFFSVWMFYSLVKSRQNAKWLILSVFLMAASYHSHITFWLYYPFLFFTLFVERKNIIWYQWLIMPILFCIIISPLIVFDLVHNFDNMLMPIKLLSHPSVVAHPNLLSHFKDVISTLGRVWFIAPFGSITDESVPGAMLLRTQGYLIFSLLSVAVPIWGYFQKKRTHKFLLSIVVWFLIAYIFYPGSVSEYYLLAFFPLFIILAGLFLSNLKVLPLIILGTIFIAINSVSIFTTSQSYGLSAKKQFIQAVSKQLNNQDFSLETKGSYRMYGGWRYLFQVYGKVPVQSSEDQQFGWIYPSEISKVVPKIKVIISDTDLTYTHVKKEIKVKGFIAYIIDNPQEK